MPSAYFYTMRPQHTKPLSPDYVLGQLTTCEKRIPRAYTLFALSMSCQWTAAAMILHCICWHSALHALSSLDPH